MTRFWFLTAALAAASGCADTIQPAEPDAAAPVDGDVTSDAPPSGRAHTTRGSDGTYTTTVDATSMTDWTHVDFATGGEVLATDRLDLRFQRFHISTNGGITGQGGVEVAPIADVPFASVTSAPATGFVSDAADGNGDGMPDYAFEHGDGWYGYDSMTDKLTPRELVWAVRTGVA